MSDFVHLHCHTLYSIDGAIRIRELCAAAKAMNLSAVAITDHGNLFGALGLFLAAKEVGIKPIFGVEFVVLATESSSAGVDSARGGYHLVLLAQNATGFRNLKRLIELSVVQSRRPLSSVIDKVILRQHSQGLVALSACQQGEVAYNVLWRGMSTAIATAQEYADIFPDRFYLELQASHSMMQTLLNELLLKVAKRCNLPVVATNDCHYLCNEDSNAHDILLRIKTGRSALASFPAQDFYYKTPQEMAQTFAHIPEAIPNTVRIAASCVVDLAPADLLMPVYSSVQSPAQGSDSVCLLSGMTIFENWTGCLDQLERELDVIEGAGFSGFYLSAERLALCGSGASRSVFPDSSDSRSSLATWRLQMESPHAISLRLDSIQKISQETAARSVLIFEKMGATSAVRAVGTALDIPKKTIERVVGLLAPGGGILHRSRKLRALIAEDRQASYLVILTRRLEGVFGAPNLLLG